MVNDSRGANGTLPSSLLPPVIVDYNKGFFMLKFFSRRILRLSFHNILGHSSAARFLYTQYVDTHPLRPLIISTAL